MRRKLIVPAERTIDYRLERGEWSVGKGGKEEEVSMTRYVGVGGVIALADGCEIHL